MKSTVAVLALTLVPWASSRAQVPSAARPDHQVRVAQGVLEGIDAAKPGVRAFLGIPYAAPPVGARARRRPRYSAAEPGDASPVRDRPATR